MSATHVALLRGINVGRAKRVAMADLRDLVGALGYGDVRTLLNSGNVVFSAPGVVPADAAARIEAALAERVGFAARVTVLSAAEWATVVDGNTLGDVADDPSRLLVAVLIEPAARERLAALEGQDWAPDVLAVGERAAYLWCASGILESRLGEAANRALRDCATTRNWSTVLKLHALLSGPPAG